ncbi:HNH endonuclease [Kordia jejudonensis]|uniref:HNH endonuclease n=1 Tax=Kordia jejudonensis TaxID=1348245 RepID=UPI000629B42D|nr:HNH endonuclease signature motif containing protein [Kordia jejudonensis]
MFREYTPKRRNITTDVSAYRKHRNDLKIDYKNRCGYCNDIDTWRFIWFEIDHFIPKTRNKKPFLTIKTETDYSNLVYSCRSCNNAKRNKWPSNNQNIPNINNKGFIDPCDDNYSEQFDRLDSGRIIPKTELGEWMYNAMKLYKPQHEIIWNIDLLDKLIDEIEELLKSSPSDELTSRLLKGYREFKKYVKDLSSAGF